MANPFSQPPPHRNPFTTPVRNPFATRENNNNNNNKFNKTLNNATNIKNIIPNKGVFVGIGIGARYQELVDMGYHQIPGDYNFETDQHTEPKKLKLSNIDKQLVLGAKVIMANSRGIQLLSRIMEPIILNPAAHPKNKDLLITSPARWVSNFSSFSKNEDYQKYITTTVLYGENDICALDIKGVINAGLSDIGITRTIVIKDAKHNLFPFITTTALLNKAGKK